MIVRQIGVVFALMSMLGTTASAQSPIEAPRAALSVVTEADRVLGRADAPVTVIEYASFVCPHCAAWHQIVLPAFTTRFIDTGQARLVFRDLPTSPQTLSLPAAALARCAAPVNSFLVAKTLMEGQAALHAEGDPNTWMQAAAGKAGRPTSDLLACMNDRATQDALSTGVEAAIVGGIRGTPMFLVNGKLIEDSALDTLSTAIDTALVSTTTSRTPAVGDE
ncbi:thioredoxin domain-containing protein [Brevundimonas variabilis]|uniref:Protein-disulfide isomerase n=1 Tax=Brevundimonas variabilis TaxID=74312 RepID=A0A7W9CI54_9CAUL|nr:thioredoxin domain-containing protein [Brevundimonas variabilis]MBB5745667.1 protein-disulfide isomerase [Brevundimonas variabilis]